MRRYSLTIAVVCANYSLMHPTPNFRSIGEIKMSKIETVRFELSPKILKKQVHDTKKGMQKDQTDYFPVKPITTVFVIRHAEYDWKSGLSMEENQKLHLNADGVARKEQLTKVLCKANVTAIFVTSYVRTQETAQQLAIVRKIKMKNYNNVKNLIKDIKSSHVGANLLVVGHSNTVPEIIEELVPTSKITIVDNEFHNLFVVSLCGKDLDKASVVNLWYGNIPKMFY